MKKQLSVSLIIFRIRNIYGLYQQIRCFRSLRGGELSTLQPYRYIRGNQELTGIRAIERRAMRFARNCQNPKQRRGVYPYEYIDKPLIDIFVADYILYRGKCPQPFRIGSDDDTHKAKVSSPRSAGRATRIPFDSASDRR